LNLATPLAFYAAFQFFGAKPAISLALAVTCLQLLVYWIYRIPLSPVFIVATGFTVLFGGIDLFLQSPRFFRLEPFAQNFLIATVLLSSVRLRIPVAAWFISGLPKKIRPDVSPAGQDYLRKLTFVWSIYLYLKAAVFLYLAFEVDLGALILLRSIIGGGSMVVLVGGELIYRKWFR
jgi:intracellular septation protein A